MLNDQNEILDIKILYVEDDELTRKGITEFLSYNIKQIYPAENGEVGLDYYFKYHPDIIITDIRMPVMNGIEMAKKIREINKDIPLIITTAYNDAEFLIKSIDIGINQFLLKPIVESKLLEAIQKCLKNFTLEQELVDIASLLSDYKYAIDESGIVFKFDRNNIITYVNDAFIKVSGFSFGELVGQSREKIKHPDTSEEQQTDIWKTITAKKVWKGIIKSPRKDGSTYYVSATVVPISGAHDVITEFIAIAYDISELINKEEELLRQLYTDRMTELPNRAKLLVDVEKALNPVLILINVDDFQQINDFYGNEIGDSIICEIGIRLKKILVSNNYSLYKMAADEYAILLDIGAENQNLVSFMQLIRDEIDEKPYYYRENAVHITVASGIAFGKEISGEDDPDAKWHHLALNADMALKKAKRMHKHFIIYDDSMQITKEYENNINWTKKLKAAIKENRIVTFYQPIFNNHTKKIEKYESLIRMIDVDGDIKSPKHFLELAKKSKLYQNLTKIVLTSSIENFRQTDFEFSINLSVDDILDEETNYFIKNKLKDNYKVAQRLVFEILESEGIENYEEVKSFIHDIKEYKCKVAVDDFGSGYSNFSHILRLNIDFIKIDSSLIKQLDKDKNTQIVTQTIVDFSKKLGILTIAEFVHSKEVYDKLLELGVDYSQGYYIGEPQKTI